MLNASAQQRRRVGLSEAKDARLVSEWETKRLPKPFQVQVTDEKGTFEGHGAVFDKLHPTSSWMLDLD